MSFWTSSAARSGKAVPVSGTARSTTRITRSLAMLGFITYIMAGSSPHALERHQRPFHLGRRYNAGPQRGDGRFSGKGEFPPHPGGGRRVRGKTQVYCTLFPCAEIPLSRNRENGSAAPCAPFPLLRDMHPLPRLPWRKGERGKVRKT